MRRSETSGSVSNGPLCYSVLGSILYTYPALRKKGGMGILPATNSHHRQDADATKKTAPRSVNT